MLVLTRKIGESIVLDGHIVVKISQISGNRVKLCVEAPKECRVIRSEILQAVQSEMADDQVPVLERKAVAAV